MSACRSPSNSPAPASTSPASTSTQRRSTQINAGKSYIPDVAAADLAALRRSGQAARDDRHEPARRAWTRSTSASRRRCARPRIPDLSYVVHAVEAVAATLQRGQLVILESTTYPGTTDEVVQPMLEAKGLEAGRRFLPRVFAGARRPGQPAVQHQEHPEDRRRRRPGQHRSGRGALRRTVRARHPGHLDARRRDGQAAREHLPRGEHRPRQRDRADVPQDGHRRLGSDRRGEDQAVRVHAVLSRARASAATASRSIRSTCRGRRGRAASSAASSSWRGRSTARCPSTSCS